MFSKHEKFFGFFQKLLDCVALAAFWYLSYLIRFQYLPNAQQGLENTFLKLSLVIIATTIYAFHKNGLYRSQRFASKYYEILTLIRANIAAVIGFVIILYFFGEERISRLTILIYFLVSSIGFIFSRLIFRNFLRNIRQRGHNLRHVLLVGNSKQLVDYVETAKRFKDSGIRFLGWIDSAGLALKHDIPNIEKTYDDYKKENQPDSIILSYTGVESHKAASFISKYYNDIIPIQLLPDLSYSMVGHKIEDFGGIPLLSINQPNLNSIELFLKRLLEFIATFIGIIIISPLLALISLLVKLSSPGPIFYSQERVGLDGKNFKMWKFRSMKVATSGQEDTKEWSNKDNPRKTKVGNFIRKTSIDELPQLWNVLIGDMSLVGPRPEQPYFVEKFRKEIPGYMLKHKMKPGITGWAQINGWRGDTSIEKRIECDIYYIKHWSLFLDLKILFLTFFKGFINKNAY